MTQERGEPGAGAVEARAHGADGDGEDEGDLLVGQLFEFAKDDDLFEEEREFVEAVADGGDGFGAGEVLGGVVVGGGGSNGSASESGESMGTKRCVRSKWRQSWRRAMPQSHVERLARRES